MALGKMRQVPNSYTNFTFRIKVFSYDKNSNTLDQRLNACVLIDCQVFHFNDDFMCVVG